MWRKSWMFAVAFVFLLSLASVADVHARPNGNQNPPNGNQGNGNQHTGNQGNGNQGNNPGNGHQNNPPGNGHQNDPPANGHQGDNPPGHGTPDGETPAQEDICDGLQSATPGLYGLCIAFCEAHDCDPVMGDDGMLDFSSCKKNDRKLLDKYRRRMRDGDPDMPCLPSVVAGEDPETACPCWSLDQLSKFPYALYGSDIQESEGLCDLGVSWTDENDSGEPCTTNYDYVGETLTLADGTIVFVDLYTQGGDCGTYECQGFFGCYPEGNCPDWLPVSDIFTNLTEEEFLNCRDQLQDLAPYCP